MPEVLLSRPILQSIGFNLDSHFAAVRDTFHDADFSHIGFTPRISSVPPVQPGKLSLILLRSKDSVEMKDDDYSTAGVAPLISITRNKLRSRKGMSLGAMR